jgi:hypothetical protein
VKQAGNEHAYTKLMRLRYRKSVPTGVLLTQARLAGSGGFRFGPAFRIKSNIVLVLDNPLSQLAVTAYNTSTLHGCAAIVPSS